MVTILDHRGNPITLQTLAEPQTARVASLHQEFANHPSRGLTPPKLAAILASAEQGDLVAQAELGEDMEEKDGHIMAELGKRKRALLTLDWDIVPPRNATAAEEELAGYARELIQDLPDFEDLLFDLLDAIGKGYSGCEIEWRREGREHLPAAFHHRPPSWFMLDQDTRTELRLRDMSPNGQALQPFGWVMHVHKAKSGYISRAGLHRILAWPYLFKNYSVRDLAEFLEIYGLPLRLGTYPAGASSEEKATLMRAVVNIGHAAAGIIPEGMMIDFKEAAKGASDPYTAMIAWCERTQSKAILGGVATSEAVSTGLGSSVANVHDDVRWDLTVSDTRQLAGTLTRDLVYPLLALNKGLDSLRRCPRFVFDTGEAEDIKIYSEALPPLVNAGMRIPQRFVHERLRIPEAKDDEPVLERAPQPASPFAAAKGKIGDAATVAAALARELSQEEQQALVDGAEELGAQWQALMRRRLEDLLALLEETRDVKLFRERLAELLGGEPPQEIVDAIARSSFGAHVLGRAQK